ncbi:MAG: hypothetical protein U0441_22600 [Polyangiaceae bacterium]
MQKPKLVTASRASRTRAAKVPIEEPSALGTGIHAAVIEMRSESAYRIRTMTGERCPAHLADGMDPALAEECLREGRTVLVTESKRGVLILGALQMSRTPVREADGSVVIEGKDVRLRAERSVVIDAGPVSFKADRTGILRFEGEKMVIDVSALVRVLSARMEIP